MACNLMGSLRSRNISQIITERIVESLLTGELKPGQRLPTEDEFAQRIGAGKSSVREAIKILEALGVVEIRRGDGTYVVDEFRGSMLDPMVYGILLSPREAADVVDFKVRVQRMAADDIVERGVREPLAKAQELLADYVPDDANLSTENDLLVDAECLLAQATANPLVGELYRQAIRICAYQQQHHAAQMLVWMRAYVAALAEDDQERVASLLNQERAILLG